jgi:RND family efflux transporter MFP subunit
MEQNPDKSSFVDSGKHECVSMSADSASVPSPPVTELKTKTRSRRSRPLALYGFGAAAVLIGIGIVPRLSRQHTLTAEAHAAETASPLVSVAYPIVTPSKIRVLLPANVQAVADTSISARTSGYVSHYYVDIGTHVKAGQLLAEIEAPETEQQLQAARADKDRSSATFGQTEADLARLKAGLAQAKAQQVGSSATLEQTRADVLRLESKALQARAAIATAKSKLDQTQKALEGRQAELGRAKVAVDLTKKTLDRWKALGKVYAVAGQEVDEKQAAYDTADASETAAKAAVDQAIADVSAAKNQVDAAEADARAADADVAAGRQRIAAAQATVQSARAGVVAASAAVQAGQQGTVAAQATIASNTANVARYATLLGFEKVIAPFDGVITARNIEVGSLVNAGASTSAMDTDPTRTVPRTGLFGIARIDVVRLQVNVPQSLISALRPGEPAVITLDEFPGRTFNGKIFDMSGALDAGSRTMLVEVRVPNPKDELIPGMYAQIQFVAQHSHPTVIIPANTLIVDAAGVRVAQVTADRKIHFLPVMIGHDWGKTMEIAEGLTGKEELVTDASDDLTEGETVEVAPAADKPKTPPQHLAAVREGNS